MALKFLLPGVHQPAKPRAPAIAPSFPLPPIVEQKTIMNFSLGGGGFQLRVHWGDLGDPAVNFVQSKLLVSSRNW